MPTASSGLRTSRPMQSLAVKASLSSERPNFGTALSQAASTVGTGLSALALSALLNLGPGIAISEASEFNVLSDGPPTESYVVDDANVLNRVTRSDLKRLLRDLEERKGYHINVITLRKLTSKADSFEFADTVRLSVLNHYCFLVTCLSLYCRFPHKCEMLEIPERCILWFCFWNCMWNERL